MTFRAYVNSTHYRFRKRVLDKIHAVNQTRPLIVNKCQSKRQHVIARSNNFNKIVRPYTLSVLRVEINHIGHDR